MIDSNTYNEIMRLCRGNVENASYTTEDVDNSYRSTRSDNSSISDGDLANSPAARLTENAAAEAELSPEERERRHQAAIDYYNSKEAQDFYRMLRRHVCNAFNALFYDKESLSEWDNLIDIGCGESDDSIFGGMKPKSKNLKKFNNKDGTE